MQENINGFRKNRRDITKNPTEIKRSKLSLNLGKLLKNRLFTIEPGIVLSLMIEKLPGVKLGQNTELTMRQLETIIEGVNEATYIIDTNGNVIYISSVISQVVPGYSPEEINNSNFLDYAHPDDLEELTSAFEEMMVNGTPSISEFRALDKDGSLRYLKASGNVIFEENEVVGAVGIISDITETRRLKEQLEQDKALLDEVGKMAKIGGWEINSETKNLIWTKALYDMHEVDSETFTPNLEVIQEFYVDENREKLEKAINEAIDEGKDFDLELEMATAKGNVKWIHAIGHSRTNEDGKIRLSGTFQDITDRKKMENKIIDMSQRDSLTSLYNRNYYEQFVEEISAKRCSATAIFIDVDGLHDINNELGHNSGDQLLVDLATILKHNTRSEDRIFRTGGDEFVIFLPTDSKEIVDGVLARIESSIAKHNLAKNTFKISVSIGTEVNTGKENDFQWVVNSADEKMLNAKKAKKNTRKNNNRTSLKL